MLALLIDCTLPGSIWDDALFASVAQTTDSIVSIALFLPSLAATVRRLRDTGRHWGNVFWVLLPVVGWTISLVQLCRPGRTLEAEQAREAGLVKLTTPYGTTQYAPTASGWPSAGAPGASGWPGPGTHGELGGPGASGAQLGEGNHGDRLAGRVEGLGRRAPELRRSEGERATVVDPPAQLMEPDTTE